MERKDQMGPTAPGRVPKGYKNGVIIDAHSHLSWGPFIFERVKEATGKKVSPRESMRSIDAVRKECCQ